MASLKRWLKWLCLPKPQARATSRRLSRPSRISRAYGTSAGHGHYGADQAMASDLAACWLDGAAFPVPAKAALEAGLAAMAIDADHDASPWLRELDAILPASSAR